jgi:uncharacterized protein DUF3105
VSKASRRRRTPGSPPPASRSTGSPPPSGATPGPAASPTGGATPASNQAASGATSRSGASATAGTAASPSGTGTSRPSGTTTRPTGSRAGRRERQRTAYQPSFFERYRTPIIVVAAVLGVALISVFVLFSASQPAYACSTVWSPTPTASPKPGATPALGYVQPDMGHVHTAPGDKVTYTYCAPASGTHYNVAGRGPIAAQVYGPGDNVIPQGWIHNLEHGGLVILYKTTSPGATPEGQAQMRAFFQAFPPAANCGPVIAPFDQMSSPFQAILWGRVLPLETFDEAQIKAFWNQWGGLTNLEPLCPTPNSRTSPSPGASAAPSVSAAPSMSTTPSASPATSAGPVAPSASPAASPS